MLELVLMAIGFLIFIALIPSIIVITPQKHVRMIETFGKFSSVRSAGLSFKLPFPIQTASAPLSLQTQQLSDMINVKTKDNVVVDVPVNVQYEVIPERAKEANYELDNPIAQMRSYIASVVRSTAPNYELEALYNMKGEMSDAVENEISEKMYSFGFRIKDVLVDDPKMTESLIEAYNRVAASKRELDAAQNYGEAEKVRRQKTAEANGQAQIITATKIAEARIILAKGNAQFLREAVEGTSLSEEYAHHLLLKIIDAETARDASANNGTVFVSMGEQGVMPTFPIPASPTKAKKGHELRESKGSSIGSSEFNTNTGS